MGILWWPAAYFTMNLSSSTPFADGNGRMGRLWQTLILRNWKPLLAFLPEEAIIHDRQKDYYRFLGEADAQADSTPFLEFMLQTRHRTRHSTRHSIALSIFCCIVKQS